VTKRLAAIVVSAVMAALLLAGAGGASGVREGGTFRVAYAGFDGIDPALFPIEDLLGPTCGSLMAFRDKPLPEGLRLRPELAEAEPVVSRDGRTYTFRVRKDARFSTGAPVTARAFAHALERILDPGMKAFVEDFRRIVGAQDVIDGKATTLRGVVARGRTLTIKLTKRDPVFLHKTTGLCAVPPSLGSDPEGAKAPLPSAAPYYAAQYVPGERLVVERNRFYRGERPHHVDRFDADLNADAGAIVDDIASGKVDCCIPTATAYAERAAELAQRYGVNRSQFWVAPGNGLRLFVLNTSRPLFKNNPRLRQAINFAVDRKALTRELGAFGGTPTDQYLLPGRPGFRDERIYPLRGPDLRKARALAKGYTRSGKAVLYTPNFTLPMAFAQILRQNLSAIGIEVEIKPFPPAIHFSQKLPTLGEPFDIGYAGWFGWQATDPSFLNWMFDGRTIADAPDFGNFSRFNSPRYNRLLEQASRLTGEERYRAYGELDVRLSRDAAPAVPVAAPNEAEFVSARVGCVVLNPDLDLTAVCLK
jgi:ABC-type transport system substrate-binding protein